MHTNTNDMGPLHKLGAAVAGLAVAAALIAAPASAGTVTATGAGTKDKQTKVEIDLKTAVKHGKTSAKTIGAVRANNAKFTCSATQYSGRDDFGRFFKKAVKVKNGKFSAVDTDVVSGRVTNRYTLEGKVSGSGSKLTITGTFQAEQSEGGLEFNNCNTGTIPFKVSKRV